MTSCSNKSRSSLILLSLILHWRDYLHTMSEDEGTAEKYEEQHVHTVYEQIADHFSSTRHKVDALVLAMNIRANNNDQVSHGL